ncbi:MAG: LPS export ABC transporter periplasmic protein LptC [Pseudomonadota bacterium]|nr:LPS export ABC transporter periplasmic protein LptC [Pseudomonadota bacterium]
MDTRLLYLIALIVVSLSGWYYWHSGKQARLHTEHSNGLDYSAREIALLQTNEQGHIQATTTAQELRHFGQRDLTELDRVNSTWYQAGQPMAKLTADHAYLRDQAETVQLVGHVQVRHSRQTDASETLLKTAQLTGYPKTRIITTDHPVEIHNSQGHMFAQGLEANLDAGDYQLSRIRIQYAPAHRP